MDDPCSVYSDPEDIVAPDFSAKPWPAPCRVCALHPHDPQHLGADVVALLKTDIIEGVVEFYCVHRLSKKGLHRVCASAAALTARQRDHQPDALGAGKGE